MRHFTRSLMMALPLVILAVSCATKNPAYTALTPAQQATNTTIPQYIPDPRIAGLSNTVSGIAGSLAPVNPYAAITDPALKYGFGLAGLIAAAIAGAMNRKKSAVINTLAAGVVKAGPIVAQAVLDHASPTDHFTAVANALNENTGINQTVTGAPKTA